VLEDLALAYEVCRLDTGSGARARLIVVCAATGGSSRFAKSLCVEITLARAYLRCESHENRGPVSGAVGQWKSRPVDTVGAKCFRDVGPEGKEAFVVVT
jgi:hypothetical protein